MRTCVSSMACSDQFGPLVAGEVQHRGFYQAVRRAFLGDGQAWNWTLQQKYFPDFVPIADFVHPLGYLYEAAQVVAPEDHWAFYLHAATRCWQGRVGDVLRELREWQVAHPTTADSKLSDDDPRAIVQATITYLEHNQTRMDYGAYRCQGLPVSSSMIESLIKEINYRVKGTEKFWNRPDGAEHILQVRAAALMRRRPTQPMDPQSPGIAVSSKVNQSEPPASTGQLKINWLYAPEFWQLGLGHDSKLPGERKVDVLGANAAGLDSGLVPALEIGDALLDNGFWALAPAVTSTVSPPVNQAWSISAALSIKCAGTPFSRASSASRWLLLLFWLPSTSTISASRPMCRTASWRFCVA